MGARGVTDKAIAPMGRSYKTEAGAVPMLHWPRRDRVHENERCVNIQREINKFQLIF